MGNLQVKNVPDGLFQELRRRAASSGLTVRDYVLRLIDTDQRLPSAEDWLGELRLQSPVPITTEDAVRAVAGAREERDIETMNAVPGREDRTTFSDGA